MYRLYRDHMEATRTRLSHASLQSVFQSGQRLTHSPQAMILHGQDAPSGVYFIETGFVRAFTLSPTGQSTIVAFLGPGQIFPLPWAVANQSNRVYYEAHTPSRVWRITRQTFQAAWSAHQDFQRAVTSSLCQEMTDLTAEFSRLSYRTAAEKVIFRLISLAKRAGRCRLQQVVIQFHVSHEDIAASTGLSRETVSRELSRLQRQRLIRRLEGRLVIPDPIRLAKRLQASHRPVSRSRQPVLSN